MGRVRSRNQMGQGDIEGNFDRRTQKVCQKTSKQKLFLKVVHRGPLHYIVSQ